MRGRCHRAKRWHSPRHVCLSSLLCPSQTACGIFCSICTWWKTVNELVSFSVDKTRLPNRPLQNKTVYFTSSLFLDRRHLCICCIPLIPPTWAREICQLGERSVPIASSPSSRNSSERSFGVCHFINYSIFPIFVCKKFFLDQENFKESKLNFWLDYYDDPYRTSFPEGTVVSRTRTSFLEKRARFYACDIIFAWSFSFCFRRCWTCYRT